MDEGKEPAGELVVAGGNPAEFLELEEKGFYQMAFLIKPPVHIPRIGVVRLGWYTEICVVVGDKLTEFPLAVSPIGENGCSFEVNLAEQFFSDRDICGVASGQK